MNQPILEVKNLAKSYRVKSLFKKARTVRALNGVSLSLQPQKTLAVIGESGCGKSTLAKVLMRIENKDDGEVYFEGTNTDRYSRQDYIRKIQMIFQDPLTSLNPRKKVSEILAEPLQINTQLSQSEIRERVLDIMAKVGLRPEFADRYPHMFSGGQRQRIGIARALTLKPQVLICDEPVSALDISIQAQVLNLLLDLQDQEKLSYVFISHDLSVVRHIADEVLVMYLGQVVEFGSRDQIFSNPLHPYTQALIASTPKVEKEPRNYKTLGGDLPSPFNLPTGCPLSSRCAFARPICSEKPIPLELKQGRWVACLFAEG
jgi:dipeptide transport system ATP-binding protein